MGRAEEVGFRRRGAGARNEREEKGIRAWFWRRGRVDLERIAARDEVDADVDSDIDSGRGIGGIYLRGSRL